MPLIYQQNIDGFTRLGVWQITEPEDFFLNLVSLQKNITHPQKRLQHLAGRMILKTLFDDFPINEIEIADSRKPFLPKNQYQFSISHCGDYAAAIVSKRSRVGVDIEEPRELILNLKNKFLSEDEMKILDEFSFEDFEKVTIGWSAKESLFKWYGDGNVNFKNDMPIQFIDLKNETITLKFKKGFDFMAEMPIKFVEDVVLTWVVSDY